MSIVQKISSAFRFLSLETVAIIVCVGACARIVYQGKLPLYIHPATSFVVVLGIIALGIVAFQAAWKAKDAKSVGTPFQRWTIYGVAALLLFVQNVGLSPALAELRSTGDIVPVTSRAGIRVNALTQQFTILEWVAAWEGDPSGERYIGSGARVEGFITEVDGKYYVNRYVVTCCAVDAQLVRLQLENGENLKVSAWYEVEGVMGVVESRPLLQVQEAREIGEPESPYLY